MKIEDVKKVLSDISFSASNLDMGWNWDIKETKIYDNGVVLEKGFSIRTTFMRPDINSGEVEKGYGRWMYVPENISSDGLVKTGWLCAELIVKHELMESFLYENKRIFDPHKSLEDLQYNARDGDGNSDKIKPSPTKVRIVPESHSPEMSKKEEEIVSSDKLFHKQNISNHVSEITKFLDKNFKKSKKESPVIDGYKAGSKNIFHYLDRKGVVISDSNSGKILENVDGVNYNLSDVSELCKDLVISVNSADPSDINSMISDRGFTDTKSQNGIFIFSNPKNKNRYIAHSESDRSIAIINANSDILEELESDDYNVINVEKLFNKYKI